MWMHIVCGGQFQEETMRTQPEKRSSPPRAKTRCRRNTTLASLKAIFHSVPRSWYLLKEEHAAVGLLLQKVILEENDQ